MEKKPDDAFVRVATISPGDGFNGMTIPLNTLEMTLAEMNDGDDSDAWVVKLGTMKRSDYDALPEHMGF